MVYGISDTIEWEVLNLKRECEDDFEEHPLCL